MNPKTSKITICFFAATILASTAYMFINLIQTPESKNEDLDKDHDHFISMAPEQIKEENIQLQEAGPGELQDNIRANGKVVLNSNQMIHIVPTATGVVKEASKNVGDKIQKGEILAILESQEMAESKLAYLDRLQKYQAASANLEREKHLKDKNISSQQDLQDKESEANQAKIELELSKQKLQTLGVSSKEIENIESQPRSTLSRYELRSPVTGTVLEKKVTRGALASKENEIYVIADLRTVSADISVFPRDMASIRTGQEVSISCAYGNSCKGKIIHINPSINPDSHTQTITLLIDNSRNIWKPGTYLFASIPSNPKQASIVIPKESIQKIELEDSIFVAKENGFEIRTIKTGRSDEDKIEVISGLTPGELYASTNTFILKAEHGKDEAQHMD